MMIFSPVFFRGVVLIALCGSLHAWENAQTNYKDSYLDKKIMSSTTAGDEGEEDASRATVIKHSHTLEDPDEIIPSFDSKRTSPASSKSNPSSANYSSTSPQSISNTRQHLIKENQSQQDKDNDELPYSTYNRKTTMKYQEESSPSHIISDDHMTSTVDYFNESFKNLRYSKDETTSTTSRNINHATSHSTHEYSSKSLFSHDDDSEEKNDDFDDKVHTEEPESHLTDTKHPIDYNKNIDWKNNEVKKKTSKKDSLSENVEITDKITLSKTEKPTKDVLKMDKHFIKEQQSSISTTINSEPLEEYYSTRNNITVSVIDNDKSVKNISVNNESGSNLLEVESVSSEVSKYPKSQAGDPPQSVNSVINSVTAENTDTFNRTPTIKYKTLPENNENKTLRLISLQGKDLPNFEKATIRPIVSDQLKLDESKNTIPVLKWEQSTEPLLKSITKPIKVPENDFNLRNDSTIESKNDIKNKIIPSKKLHIVETTPSTDVDNFNPLEDLGSKSSTAASTVPRANIDFKTKLGLSSTIRTTKNSATSIDSVPEVVKLAENISTVLELSTSPGVLTSETNSPPEMVLESDSGTSTTVSNDILVKPIIGFSTRKRPPASSYLVSKVTFPSTDISTTTEPSIITTKISNHSTSTILQSRRSSSLENVSLNANRTGFSQTESTSVKPFVRWSTRLLRNNSIITTDLPTSVTSETPTDNDMTSFSESTSTSVSSSGVSSESPLVKFSSLTPNSIESTSLFETSTESPVTTEVPNQASSSSYVTSESVSVKVSELYSSTEPLNSSEAWEENSPSSPLSSVPLSSSSPSYSENFMSTWSSSYPSLTTASLDLRNSSRTTMSSSDFTTESLNPDKTTDYVTPSSFASSSSNYISQSSTDVTESPISNSQPSSTLDYNLRSSTDGAESPIFSSEPSSTLDYNFRSSPGITDGISSSLFPSSLSTENPSSTSSNGLLMSVSSVTKSTGTSAQTSPSPEPESTPSSTTGSEFSYTSESVSELSASESTSQTPDYELLFNSSVYFSSTENTLDGRTSSGSEYPTNATTEFTDYSASSFSSSSSSPSDSSTVMPTISNSITTTGNINLNKSDFSIFEEGTTLPASTVPEFSADDSSEDDYWFNSNITDHSINKIQQHTVSTTENVLAPIHPTFGDIDSGEDEDDRSKSESPLTPTVHHNVTKDITKPPKVLWSKVTIDNNNIFGKNNTNSKSTTSGYQELDNVSVIPGTKDKNFSKPDMTIADIETTTVIHAPKEETTFILHTTSENSKDGNQVSHNWSTEIVPEYLIINTSSSWAEACRSEDHLRNVIIRLFKNGTGRNLYKNQVVFLNLTPHLCKQLENPDSPATIQMSFFSESGDTVSSSLNGDFLRLYRLKGLESNLKIQDVQLMVSSRRVSNDEIMDDSAAIAAIAISCIAVVCIVLLGVLLVILRKRQKGSSYGQRCTPVSIDDYSLDNISVYNSVRRKNAIRASKRSYGNPAFDDPGAVSHPLNFATLANFCTNRAAVDDEFSQIPVVSPKMDELPPGAETKNRYSNVIPLPETRVHLSMPEGGDTLSDYINANFVKGPKGEEKFYIACQAPMQSTVNDFWRMIWEQQSKVILMLTDLHENGVEKCYDYLPPSEVLDCHRLFGDYQVTLKKREVREKYIISSLQLKNLETNLWREVTHMWYMNWPHQGVPEEGTSIIAFLIEARSYMRSTSGSTVVHCSPGTGRTGTVLAIDLSIRDFETNRLVDIPKTVYALRRDRAGSVQTKDQYAFIYQVLNIYAAKLTGGALDSI